jgi:uncharacterized protein YndB with AHSA1/START domain
VVKDEVDRKAGRLRSPLAAPVPSVTIRVMTEQVSVTRQIGASAEQVWAMVSDVTRMGQWSPENEGATWLGAATGPQRGARFRGMNRNGKRRWKTVGRTVADAETGRRFCLEVSAGA